MYLLQQIKFTKRNPEQKFQAPRRYDLESTDELVLGKNIQ